MVTLIVYKSFRFWRLASIPPARRDSAAALGALGVTSKSTPRTLGSAKTLHRKQHENVATASILDRNMAGIVFDRGRAEYRGDILGKEEWKLKMRRDKTTASDSSRSCRSI